MLDCLTLPLLCVLWTQGHFFSFLNIYLNHLWLQICSVTILSAFCFWVWTGLKQKHSDLSFPHFQGSAISFCHLISYYHFQGLKQKIQIWAIPFPMTLLFPHNCVLPHCVMLLELEPLFHRASTLLAVSFSWAMATLWRGGHHFNKHVPYHVEFFLPY